MSTHYVITCKTKSVYVPYITSQRYTIYFAGLLSRMQFSSASLVTLSDIKSVLKCSPPPSGYTWSRVTSMRSSLEVTSWWIARLSL